MSPFVQQSITTASTVLPARIPGRESRWHVKLLYSSFRLADYEYKVKALLTYCNRVKFSPVLCLVTDAQVSYPPLSFPPLSFLQSYL